MQRSPTHFLLFLFNNVINPTKEELHNTNTDEGIIALLEPVLK